MLSNIRFNLSPITSRAVNNSFSSRVKQRLGNQSELSHIPYTQIRHILLAARQLGVTVEGRPFSTVFSEVTQSSPRNKSPLLRNIQEPPEQAIPGYNIKARFEQAHEGNKKTL